MNWENELALARKAAREAGELLVRSRREQLEVLSAHGRDIKLQADRDSERLIAETLNAGSGFPILAEESGASETLGEKTFWVVDPLDGTLNYQRGVPLCCVSVALVRGSEPLLGVVYDFNRDELFSGVAGEGAWLNGEPISVSAVEDSRQGVLATGFPVNRDYGEAALHETIRQFQQFKKIRMFGTAALSLAWVACGRVEAYFEEGIMLWDVAAGMALVRAAGGFVEVQPSARLEWAGDVRCSCSPAIWKFRGQRVGGES